MWDDKHFRSWQKNQLNSKWINKNVTVFDINRGVRWQWKLWGGDKRKKQICWRERQIERQQRRSGITAGNVETRGAMCWSNRSGSRPIGQRGPPWPRWGHRHWCHHWIWGMRPNKVQTTKYRQTKTAFLNVTTTSSAGPTARHSETRSLWKLVDKHEGKQSDTRSMLFM